MIATGGNRKWSITIDTTLYINYNRHAEFGNRVIKQQKYELVLARDRLAPRAPNWRCALMTALRKSLMKLLMVFVASLLLSACSHIGEDRRSAQQEIELRLAEAHKGWERGDLDAMLRYEHPQIHKLIAFDKVIVGEEQSRRDLAAAVRLFDFKICKFEIEDFREFGGVATFYALVTLEGTPKKDGYAFSVTSRTFSVWTREPSDPRGWAAVREVVQQAKREENETGASACASRDASAD